ncbi:thioredoxin domain-containing protein [Branchiibius sp. NY16-3462-2]|uniref:DsbA family protein n=1 Tax=Branchiibius sp. NY16-3462-2 TaxID=1807500 RepID=UPI000795BC15|nr:thioredoxin domain-containing protein [Branchiibius sp. NY16-3462-2]KYH42862.1 hypothetical protein AZH51_16375 [Branchiibius sp. NY16-3462-2]
MPRPDAAERLKASAPKQGPSKALIAALIATVLVIAGVAAFLVTRSGGTENAAVPTGGIAGGKGVVAFPDATLQPGAKTVDVYEDFQCPFCKQLEAHNGQQLQSMAADGKVKLVLHVKTFLDDSHPGGNSLRAANAAFCAADAGRFPQFHSTVFANQPATEGEGYTDDQLKSFGKDAGISGSAYDTFVKCVDDEKYKDYAEATETQSGKDGVTSTPTLVIDGKEVDQNGADYAALMTQDNSFDSVVTSFKG